MKLGKHKGLPFYCFSPPVMMATFLLEIGFLFYVFVRYKMNTLTRLITLLLFFLATFQLAEYNVCGGFGTSAATWSQIGFVAITILPSLGIHLAYTIAKRPWSNITGIAYGMALAWITIFAFSEKAFSGHVCAGNYVIFQLKPTVTILYFIYYYLWLFIGGYLCFKFARGMRKNNRESLMLLALGYATFLIPTTMANMINPKTVAGIPSVMCGFAIILAIILTFTIMPRVGTVKKK